MQASGLPEGKSATTRKEFGRLVTGIPKLSGDLVNKTMQIKKALEKEGFSYDPGVFRAQNVIGNRKGNCLGLPLLAGSILGERGIQPKYKLVINPQDAVSGLEDSFLKGLNNEMPYDTPTLAKRNEEFPLYRFEPLEHLVLDANGGILVEMTSSDGKLKGYETAWPVTFDQALSCLYRDRAIEAQLKAKDAKAKQLARRGFRLWGGNRELNNFLAGVAHEEGDEKTAQKHAQRYLEIGGDDSRFHLVKSILTSDPKSLDKALEKYPCYAQAISMKATSLTETDPREARFSFATASQLFANSQVLDLRNFYVINRKQLNELFGQEEIRKILKGLAN